MAVRTAVEKARATGLSRIGQRRQIVIPKLVFDQMGLAMGDFLEIRREGGRLVMQPKRLVDVEAPLTPTEAKLVRKGEAELRKGKGKSWNELRDGLAR